MLDFIKIKNFCSKKGPVKRTKRQAMNWEKIFADHVPGKGLLLRIYEELSKPNSGKTSNPILKMGKNYEHIFHQRGYTYDQKNT